MQWSRHWMLVFVPVALLIEHLPGMGPPVVFFVAALAVVPVARLIGHSTEHLTHYTGDSVGGLLNVLFGNVPELIIGLVALEAGLYPMVAASLVGAILFNLLLVLGLCFLLGGLRYHTLVFNARAVRVYSTMMFISVMSLALPSIYEHAFGSGGPTLAQEKINIGLAVLLLALFALYLVFMIRTHPEEFASVASDAAASEHETRWSLPLCIAVLVGSSIAAAILSEILVGAVEGTGEVLGLSSTFLGIVLLASVGAAAEASSAISMARKGRFDLSLSIALGSCILIAIFVAPVLALASYFIGPHSFLLAFGGGSIAMLFLAVLIGAMVASGESANWYKGAQLIAVYLMIALLLYFVPL